MAHLVTVTTHSPQSPPSPLHGHNLKHQLSYLQTLVFGIGVLLEEASPKKMKLNIGCLPNKAPPPQIVLELIGNFSNVKAVGIFGHFCASLFTRF